VKKQIILLTLISLLAFTQVGWGQQTYTWTGATDNSWATSTNWTPERTPLATSDVLQFNGGGTVTVTAVPTQTIAQLTVSGSTIVNLQSAAAVILTIGGAAGTDLSVDATSQLNCNNTTGITIAIATTATGSILGNMTFSGGVHKITAVDAAGLTFQSGSTFTQGLLCTGNVFGASGGTTNSVVFASGSTFIQKTGSNPFASPTPASIVQFQTGSLFSNQQTGTPSFSGRTYANFEQDCTVGPPTITVTGGGAVSIDNFTVKNGTFLFNMTGHSSAIKGNITVLSGATLNFNPLTPGDTVSLGGSSLQTISNAGTMAIGGSNNFPVNIVITNPAGVQLSSGTLTIQNSAKVTLGNNNLTIASGATLATDATSYIVTNGTGALIQTVGSSATFPIGDIAYRPVTLASVTGGSPVISARVTNANAGGTFDGSLSSISPTRYWAIGLVSGAFTYFTLNLTYGNDDGVTDNTNLRIGMNTSSSAAGAYSSLGGTGGSANTSGNITSGLLGYLGTPSYFLLANAYGGTNPLPVELSSFTSTMNGRNVQLNWETKTEVAFNKFEIDRASVNANDASVTWASVGKVSASGTSNSPRKYSFTEKDLQAGKYQYRLKMIDNDGSYKLSAIVETDITSPKNFELSQNYPNPFNPSTKISYSLPSDSRVTLEVYNVLGVRVAQLVNKDQSAGYYSVDFNSSSLGKSISSGVYLYKITTVDKATGNNFSAIKKMMLLK
jgi:hypothetical protein